MEKREGDWNCMGCGDYQFGRNSNCRKCGKAKPGTSGPDRQPLMIICRNVKKLGDWYCTNCGTHQFASRTQCRSCGKDKCERRTSTDSTTSADSLSSSTGSNSSTSTGGVVMTQAEMRALFDQWVNEKNSNIDAATSTITSIDKCNMPPQ